MVHQSKLFQPVQVGDFKLQHRVALAPLTRFRADEEGVHHSLGRLYYEQRASTPGTLLISEGGLVDPDDVGIENTPGFWSESQLAGWRDVTDAVHAKGSFIFAQLFSLGRSGDPEIIRRKGKEYVAPSALPLPDSDEVPRELTTEEIKGIVRGYAKAAENAVKVAGFDGVEIHGANGYLLDQFIQDNSNQRTDEYGGSIENRSRFFLEVLDVVVEAVGPTKVGARFSPFSLFQGMKMADPVPTFSYLISAIRERHPDFAYLHMIEPRIDGNTGRLTEASPAECLESLDFAREIWRPKPFIAAGGYTAESAKKRADETGDIIAMGRPFIANPDLPLRIRYGTPLQAHDRATFHTPGEVGYTDYAFAEELRGKSIPVTA